MGTTKKTKTRINLVVLTLQETRIGGENERAPGPPYTNSGKHIDSGNATPPASRLCSSKASAISI